MSAQAKKRDWFDLGAMAYRQACPGIYAAATYVCPICRRPFTVEALDDGRLSKEHVPPQSVGGCELLLTCTECNNTAGTKLDTAAKTKEDVRLAMTGGPDRPHRIKATIGGITVNGQLHAKDGSYSLTIPKHLNRPGTREELQRLGRAGTSLTVEHERYSELGARISWLRAGYLALVAMEGYKIVLDPAMDIVRTQIRECDERSPPDIIGTLLMARNAMKKNITKAIAEMTGGEYELFTTRKGFEVRLVDFNNQLHSRYVLSFAPQAPHPGLHQIQVRLKQSLPRTTVLSRTGYWAQGTIP